MAIKFFREMSRKQRAAWVIVMATAVATTGLSALTAINYSGIVETRILTAAWLDTEILPTFQGPNVTTLRLIVNLTVDNPGVRGITLTTVGYRAWLRDMPAENGSDTSRFDFDGIIQPDEFTKYFYYPVFTLSWDLGTIGITVGSHTNETVTLLDREYARSEAPDTFRNLGVLYATSGGEPEWLEYCVVVMFVAGVPHHYVGSGSSYLIELPTTHRYFGYLLYSGRAGLVNT